MTTGGLGGQRSGDYGDGSRGSSYGGNPRDTDQGQDPFDRNRFRRFNGGGAFMNQPPPQQNPFPFMFGVPTKDLIPNYMPQIAPMNQGNPQSVEQLYSMYGATPNAPMPVAPNVPPPQPAPQPQPALGGQVNLQGLLQQYPQLARFLGG